MSISNPITGTFGTGNVRFFYGLPRVAGGSVSNFVVPAGISSVRVRLWGAGNQEGTSSGFAIKTIYGLVAGQTIVVTAANAPTTTTRSDSSFGSFVSVTGGSTFASASRGTGVGGDINYLGGFPFTAGQAAAGTANIFGNASDGFNTSTGSNGVSGGGCLSGADTTPTIGGNGVYGSGGINYFNSGFGAEIKLPTSGLESSVLNLDAIGAGGGGANRQSGVNGGGAGGSGGFGGFPGGGGNGSNSSGGAGLVIVEW
jgi:hypothetical protein